MKIGLIDVDGRKFPNLALMKISSFHKANGDSVEWATIGHYDTVYASKVFSFTPEKALLVTWDVLIKGGTGYNFDQLPREIDDKNPDYTIYPKYGNAYGFLTRGCPNKCGWCIVPSKEGDIKPYSDIEDILQGRRTAVLMDNNVLAHEHGLSQIEKIVRLGVKVDFNQGLDAMIIANNEGVAELLGAVKWLKPIRMACDTASQMQYIEKATQLLRKHNATPKRYFVYVLVKSISDAMDRVMFLDSIGLDPFAQPFIDFKERHMPSKE